MMRSNYVPPFDFGLLGQRHDNFLCLTKRCRDRKKLKQLTHSKGAPTKSSERKRLRKERKELKHVKKRAKVEGSLLDNLFRRQKLEDAQTDQSIHTNMMTAIAREEEPPPAPEAAEPDTIGGIPKPVLFGVAGLVVLGAFAFLLNKKGATPANALPTSIAAP